MGKTSSLKHIPEQIKILEKNKKMRLVITMCAVLLSAFIQAWAIQVLSLIHIFKDPESKGRGCKREDLFPAS